MGSSDLALGAIGVLLFYTIVNRIISSISAHKFSAKHGCQPAPRYPQTERLIGYRLFKDVKQSQLENRSLEDSYYRSLALGTTYTAAAMGKHCILTTDPENVKTVLTTNFKDFGLGDRLAAFGPLLGSGIFTADGAHWEHSRALVRPNFSRNQIANLEAFETHVQDLVRKIPQDGSTIDLQPLFFNQTLDSATEFLFGESAHSQVSPEGSRAHEFSEAFDYAQSQLTFRHRLGRLSVFIYNPKFSAACKTVHEWVDQFVFKALEYRKMHGTKTNKQDGNIENSSSTDERYVFLNELAKVTSDPKQLRDELLNILLAGRDTTAGLLSHTIHALARHPDVWTKLKHEVDTLEGRKPNYESLRNMQYLKSVLNEVLRLYPSVPANARFAKRNTVLPRGGGPDGRSPVFVPEGAVVGYSMYSIHRRRDIFGADSLDFRPERWAADAPGGPLRPGWAYLPFNGGPRICVGQQYALTEASYTIVRLLQTFEAIENRDPSPWVEQLGVTLCSANGVKVGLLSR
ncbi:MAG: hypothetical protein Q9227_006200 [Pyrenula ochraceoflavens]